MASAEITINGSALGSALQDILECDEILPGTPPSYQTCKNIYAYHPLGKKMADVPIDIAMSQQREVSIPAGPERVRERFLDQRKQIGADANIKNAMRVARVYGVSSLALLAEGVPTDRPLDPKRLPELNIAFNVYDPLNTSGSLVLSQQPLAMDFLKPKNISVSGSAFHRSRAVITLNEEPLYIEWTTSAFGYVGRSVFQRAFYPLKSFLESMITDDMVVKKAGLLVSKRKQPGSIIDSVMQSIAGIQRSLLQSGKTGNVLSIGDGDAIETLNFQNLEGPMMASRKNIIDNIASAASMPAKLLNSETFAEGFGEGTEDAKAVAHYIDGLREEMAPLYEFTDRIAMYRAWTPEFFAELQRDLPESYGGKGYTQAFYEWRNSFKAEWPSLLKEPEPEQVKVADTKLKALIGAVQVLEPLLDPENRAKLIQWFADNINEDKLMFRAPLEIDIDALLSWEPEELPEGEERPAPPFSGRDSASVASLLEALGRGTGGRRRRLVNA